MMELIEKLKNSKIRYIPFYDFCLENLKEKMCAEYTICKEAVTYLIGAGAAITSDGKTWKIKKKRSMV